MPESLQERAKALFLRVAEQSLAERESLLDEVCAGDPALRAEVDSLLAQLDAGTATFLRTPAPTGRPGVIAPFEPGQTVGGEFKLLEILGEGGLGVVWLAEQAPPMRRQVALKVVKLGMDSKQVLARFETERNALALMDHPNIARVLDAGMAEQGQPFFVMEHVPGVPITAFCDAERLTTAERLGVFVDVCRAVQHAHQKGVIHRDLKPSNILVTLHDGQPVPKVIDFGIAKATAGRLTENTLFTEQGQLLGTPEYMSPEQAEMNGLGVDSTSDIYSLGVVLYELLTGVLPFDSKTLRDRGLAEISRVIREVDPERPSSRITALGKRTTTIAATHRTDPRTLRSQLSGDLDWIVMKALEKQRARRYASASELAGDVERHLNDEPVLAAAPSFGYRLAKSYRRHRVGFLAAAAVLVALIAGIVGTTWQWMRAIEASEQASEAKTTAKEERDKALDESARATASLDFLIELLQSSDPAFSLRPKMSVRDLLDIAAKRVEKLAGQPEVEAKIRRTIGRAYWTLGEMDLARRHLSRALRLQDEFAEPPLDELFWVLTFLAATYEADSPEAAHLWVRAWYVAIDILSPEHPALAAQCQKVQERLLIHQRHMAATSVPDLIAMGRATLEPDDRLVFFYTWHLYATGLILGRFRPSRERQEMARDLLQEALRIGHLALPRGGLERALVAETLAPVLIRLGDLPAAETLIDGLRTDLREVLGENHYRVHVATALLATILARRGGDQERAEAMARSAHDAVLATVGDRAGGANVTSECLCRVYLAGGKVTEAIDAWKVRASIPGKIGAMVELARGILAARYPEFYSEHWSPLYAAVDAALPTTATLLRECREARREAFGNDDPCALAYAVLLEVCQYRAAQLGSLTRAERTSMMEEALDIWRAHLPAAHENIAEPLYRLARLHERTGQFEKGERYIRDALAICDKLGRSGLVEYKRILGACLTGQGRYQEAVPWLEEAFRLQRQVGTQSSEARRAHRSLLVCYVALDRSDDALRLWATRHDYPVYVPWQVGRRVLAARHPQLEQAMARLRELPRGPPDALATEWEAVQAARRTAFDDDHVLAILYAELLSRIASGLADPDNPVSGEIEVHRQMFEEILAIQAAHLGDHPKTAKTLWWLALLRVRSGQWAAGETIARRCVTMLGAIEGELRESSTRASARTLLGGCLVGQRRFGEAEVPLDLGYRQLVELEGARAPSTFRAVRFLVDLDHGQGRLDRAATRMRAVFRAVEAHRGNAAFLGRYGWLVARRPGFDAETYELARTCALRNKSTSSGAAAQAVVGALHYRLQQYDAAIAALEQAIRLRSSKSPVDSALLAMAYRGRGDHDKARAELANMRELVRQGARWRDYQRCLLEEAEALIDGR